jgi:hypothetical protein
MRPVLLPASFPGPSQADEHGIGETPISVAIITAARRYCRHAAPAGQGDRPRRGAGGRRAGPTRIPAPAATTSSSRSTARSTRPGHSATSPTPSTCATYGYTPSTRPAPPASRPHRAVSEVLPGCGLISDGLRRRTNAPRASVRTELGPAPARHRLRATGSPWRAFWTWSVAGY